MKIFRSFSRVLGDSQSKSHCTLPPKLSSVNKKLLKFKPSIRMGKKGDLSDFERGMVVSARRAGLSI